MKPRRQHSLLAAAIVFLLVAGCAGEKPPSTKAVFLIVVDTLRPDRLSCYGYHGHETPHIDRLADGGTRFDNAVSVASWTVPSMGSILTSLYPTQLGLVETEAKPGQEFSWRARRNQLTETTLPAQTTLADVFRSRGFSTGAFVDQPGLVERAGFSNGFDDFYFAAHPDSVRRLERGDTVAVVNWQSAVRRAAPIDAALIETLDDWLGRHADQKLFVWLHLLTPHRPHNPPPDFRLPANDEAMSESYDAEIRYTDELIGRALASIENRVGLDRAVIVFTSDHGEAFGEHGMFEHGHTLHHEVVAVPLVLSGRGVSVGKAVKAQVRTIDLFPTLLDLAGLEGAAPDDIQGQSLLPVIEGRESDRPVYSEAMLYGSTERSLATGGFKLMYDQQDERYTLFDLDSDIEENRDVFSDHIDHARKMRSALIDLHHELAIDYRVRLDRAPGDAVTKEEAERVRRAMRSLGYVNE